MTLSARDSDLFAAASFGSFLDLSRCSTYVLFGPQIVAGMTDIVVYVLE